MVQYQYRYRFENSYDYQHEDGRRSSIDWSSESLGSRRLQRGLVDVVVVARRRGRLLHVSIAQEFLELRVYSIFHNLQCARWARLGTIMKTSSLSLSVALEKWCHRLFMSHALSVRVCAKWGYHFSSSTYLLRRNRSILCYAENLLWMIKLRAVIYLFLSGALKTDFFLIKK